MMKLLAVNTPVTPFLRMYTICEESSGVNTDELLGLMLSRQNGRWVGQSRRTDYVSFRTGSSKPIGFFNRWGGVQRITGKIEVFELKQSSAEVNLLSESGSNSGGRCQ